MSEQQQLLCPNCIATIRPSKIPPMGTLVRCPKCNETFLIDPTVIVGPGSGPAFGSVPPPPKAQQPTPTANRPAPNVSPLLPPPVRPIPQHPAPGAPQVRPAQPQTARPVSQPMAQQPIPQQPATQQQFVRPIAPMQRPMPAAPQMPQPNAYAAQPNAYGAQPHPHAAQSSVLVPLNDGKPVGKSTVDNSSAVGIPGWTWGLGGAAIAVVLMLVAFMIFSGGGKDDRQLAAGANGQAADDNLDANNGGGNAGGVFNADPPVVQGQPGDSSKPSNAGKKNGGGPVAEVQLNYNFKPDMNYMYDFELESGHDENGPLQSKGSITYTALPNMRQANNIPADRPKRKAGGSAFMINSDGVMVTCAHVVADATKIEVLVDNKNYKAKVLHVDTDNDLAVIQIDGRNFRSLPLAAAEPLVGDDIFVAGYPLMDILGDTLKVTRGSVAGFVDDDGKHVLQIDATVQHGNSGCPVLTSSGSVVGVASFVISGREISQVNFARDLRDVKAFLKENNVPFAEASSDRMLRGNEVVTTCGPAIGRVLVEIEEPKPKQVMRVRFNGSTRQGKDQTQKATSGTVSFAPDGEVLGVEGESDYSLISTSTGRLIFDALPPPGQHRWKAEHESNVVEYEQSQPQNGAFPPGFGGPFGPRGGPRGMRGPGMNPFFQNQPEQKVLRRLKLEERMSYELKELTADKALVNTHVVCEWIDPTTKETALEMESDGHYTFDRARAAISEAESNGKVRTQTNGVETTFPVRLAFMLKEAVTSDEMKQRAEKQRKDVEKQLKDVEERNAQVQAVRETNFLAGLPDAIDVLKSSNPNAAKVHEAFRLITPLGWTPKELPRRDEVASLLNRYLKSNDEWTLHQASDAAAVWATQVNAEALLALVPHTDYFVRRGAIKALGQMEPSEKIANVLAKSLEADARDETAEALIKMKKFAEAPTIPFLKSNEWVTRHAALKVLGEVGGKESLAPIEAIANGSDQIDVHVAKEALTAIRTRIAAGKE